MSTLENAQGTNSDHIGQLTQYDNEQGYKLSYKKVKKKLEPTIHALIAQGEATVDALHELLKNEETWSCLFILEILKEIKSEKSIQPLITFLKETDDGDYWESGEEAMFALTAIGKSAIAPLIKEIKQEFQAKECYTYIVGAFTEIKDEAVAAFMLEILKDYLKNPSAYDEWLDIDFFILNFDKQDCKEAIPLLQQLLTLDSLSRTQKREIKATIEVLEDPEKYQQEMDKAEIGSEYNSPAGEEKIKSETDLLKEALQFEDNKKYDEALSTVEAILNTNEKSYHALTLKVRIKRKQGKPDMHTLVEVEKEAKKQHASQAVLDLLIEERENVEKLFEELQHMSDEDFELQFVCSDCGKRQNLKTGQIWMTDENRAFENEIMCKHCYGHNIELTKHGHMELMGKSMRMVRGEDQGIIFTHEKVMVNNKLMHYNKTYSYILDQIKKDPENGELQLRAGNNGRKHNKYDEAIQHYEQAIALNPKLIAVYINLIEIYDYRLNYYGIADVKENVLFYLQKLKELYGTHDYTGVTIANNKDIIHLLREYETSYGTSNKYKPLAKDEVTKTITRTSILDVEAMQETMEAEAQNQQEEAKQLLEEGRGAMVFQSYLVIDQKTREAKKLMLSSIMLAEPDKMCICGSGKYLKMCCYNLIKNRTVFVANNDGEFFSPLEMIEKTIRSDEKYDAFKELLKTDPQFFCMGDKGNRTMFVYCGKNILMEEGKGTLIFGDIILKRALFSTSKIRIEAASGDRLNMITAALQEHLSLE